MLLRDNGFGEGKTTSEIERVQAIRSRRERWGAEGDGKDYPDKELLIGDGQTRQLLNYSGDKESFQVNALFKISTPQHITAQRPLKIHTGPLPLTTSTMQLVRAKSNTSKQVSPTNGGRGSCQEAKKAGVLELSQQDILMVIGFGFLAYMIVNKDNEEQREAAKVLAQTIDERTTEVRDALFDSGVKISPNATKEDLVDGVIENFGYNKRLQRKIGTLAMEVSPSSFAQGRSFKKQSGDKRFLETQAGQQTLETGGQVVEFSGKFLGSASRKQAQLEQDLAESKAKSDMANADLVKSQLALENLKLQAKTAMTPQAKLLMGIVLVAAVGAGFYFYSKGKTA